MKGRELRLAPFENGWVRMPGLRVILPGQEVGRVLAVRTYAGGGCTVEVAWADGTAGVYDAFIFDACEVVP